MAAALAPRDPAPSRCPNTQSAKSVNERMAVAGGPYGFDGQP